jgi:hypothetical protein
MTRPSAAALAISLNDPRYPKSLKEFVGKHARGKFKVSASMGFLNGLALRFCVQSSVPAMSS